MSTKPGELHNPYDPTAVPGSVLKIEDENFDPETNEQREIECWAIASKRCGLFIRNPDGKPRVVATASRKKRSEHGLGHLLPPHAPNPELDDRRWIDEWWQHLLELELGFDSAAPDWFDEPAIGRLTITTVRDLRAFATFNRNHPHAQQVKPWNFLCVAHPADHERARQGGPRTLIAPFERDPAMRRRMLWLDRDQPAAKQRTVRTADAHEIDANNYAVLSYRDYFEKYRLHPETKSADPSDGRACHTWTRGLLVPSRVAANARLLRIGKESNRLAEDAPQTDSEEGRGIEYEPPSRTCHGCGLSVSRRARWCSDRCRKRWSRGRIPTGAPRT